jgi:hypothetical protein
MSTERNDGFDLSIEENVLPRVRVTVCPPGSLCLLRFRLPLRKLLENLPKFSVHQPTLLSPLELYGRISGCLFILSNIGEWPIANVGESGKLSVGIPTCFPGCRCYGHRDERLGCWTRQCGVYSPGRRIGRQISYGPVFVADGLLPLFATASVVLLVRAPKKNQPTYSV